MQSDFDYSFRRAVDSAFNNRDSRSGKLIKPHDVEGKRSTLGEDTYFKQTPLSASLNASEIRQMNLSSLNKEIQKKKQIFLFNAFSWS
jgi:hypothetical protein